MSRSKSSSDTPPSGPSSLINDFQSFCSYPELTAAFKENPVCGATVCESKKQSTTADSSTTAEVAGSALAYPDIQYASSIFEELGFPQPTTLGTGSDNQSTMKLLQNPAIIVKVKLVILTFVTTFFVKNLRVILFVYSTLQLTI